MTKDQAIAHMRKVIKEVGGQKAFAAKAETSQGFVSEMLSEKKALSDAVLAAAGLERVVTFRKAR